MRVLIFGGSGMLGHCLCHRLSDHMDVWATFRVAPKGYHFLPVERQINNVLAEDINSVKEVLDGVKPDVVINAVGIVKRRNDVKQASLSIQVNSLFPQQLADLCENLSIRVIQISTDCVFSGLRGKYSESDIPDPVDLYGRTKLIGELDRSYCLTLRTSFIGWELSRFASLLSWFACQRGKHIMGYKQAIFTGISTPVMADLIRIILLNFPNLGGIYHVASEPISKYELLTRFRDILGWNDIYIEPDDLTICDRSLIGAHFNTATGWHSPEWEEMLQGLKEDWLTHGEYYPKTSRS